MVVQQELWHGHLQIAAAGNTLAGANDPVGNSSQAYLHQRRVLHLVSCLNRIRAAVLDMRAAFQHVDRRANSMRLQWNACRSW